MKILVTGASGFIGSRTVKTLANLGHEVASLGRNPPRIDGATFKRITHLTGRFDNPPWDGITKFSPEACLHSAWINTPGICLESEENDLLALNSKKFLLRLEQMGVGHFTILGTCLEYNLYTKLPLREENSPLASHYPYTQAKIRLHEELLQTFSPSTVFTWARIFYAYGSGEPPEKLISSLIRQASCGNPMEIKHPDNVVDYIHVNDIASALATIMEKSPGGTINVGTGQGILLRDLAKKISEQLDCPKVPQFPTTHEPQKPTSIVADNSRLRSLGWEQKISLEIGIRELIRDIAKKSPAQKDPHS